MIAKVYSLQEYKKNNLQQTLKTIVKYGDQLIEDEDEEDCVDDVVSDWIEALHKKIFEIYCERSAEAAYQFHHRVCGTDLGYSKTFVEIVVSNYEELEI